MSSSALTTSLSIPALRSTVRGRVIGPDDADYDTARTVFLGDVDRRPAVIVRPVDADDVARSSPSPVRPGSIWPSEAAATAPRAMASTEGGIVLDLGDMRSIDIDVEGQTVWAQTGLTAAELSTALGAHGLAVGFGDTGSVGIGGITLGGGDRLSRAQVRHDDRFAARRRHRHRRWRDCSASTPRRTRTCSGRSAAAAATSASRPRSSSGSTRSPDSSAGC